jgi:hypothetical protein
MADTRCVAIKSSDGQRCTKRSTVNARCASHDKIRTRDGPNLTEISEIEYMHVAAMKIAQNEMAAQIAALGPDPWRNNRELYTEALRVQSQRTRALHAEKNARKDAVRARQLADIARTGINPDAVQEAARAAERERQHAEHQARIAAWRAEQAQRQPVQQVGQQAVRVDARPLAAFANDRQNVHTTGAVKQTLRVIREILKIEVPVEYRWNMKVISKTISEIIAECYLTPAAAWQMMAKYCSDDTIYDLEPGIYGKVLDCVWQYIKNSTDKEDLKKILKSEMKDNIGMCAQGNLSRLTNILAGYVECVVVEESITDKLGRLLPPLMEIDDIVQRLNAAARIFVENGVPEDQWAAWAGGLVFDQADDDYREMFIHDGVIDFVVFT